MVLNQNFTNFDLSKGGASTKTIASEKGIFFTDSTNEAGGYADLSAK